MSSLIFYTESTQAFIATDTLAVSERHEPVCYTSKALLLPHLRLVIASTGLAGVLSRWFLQVNDGTVVWDVDHLNIHTPQALQALWAVYKEELAVPEQMTVTLYHFGVARDEEVIHAYAYRSEHGFRSERVPYGVGTKPVIPFPNGPELPLDIRAMMEAQRANQAAFSSDERVYIGGEILVHHLTPEKCQVYTLDRFDDYEANMHTMFANFARNNPGTA